MAINNKPASAYAKPHGVTTSKTGPHPVTTDDSNTIGYKTDPNSMSADESTPGGMPARRVSIGNMTRGPKTDGVKQRGAGAATKGFTSRGPLA